MAHRADHMHPDVNRRRILIGMGLAAPFLAATSASALRRRGAALDGKTDDLEGSKNPLIWMYFL